jgi:hypothetical protein
MGTFTRTVSVDDFIRPRAAAGEALLWSSIVTGVGTLILTCTIGVLATAFLLVGSLHAGRKLVGPQAYMTNTALLPSAPISPGPDEEAPSPVFNVAQQPEPVAQGGRIGRWIEQAFWQNPSPLSSLAMTRDAALYAYASTGPRSQSQDTPPLPRPRSASANEAMYRPMAPFANAKLSESGAINLDLPTSLEGIEPNTALYDIEAHVVYMPNGETLEAHSGLGDRLDDVRFVSEKNRGATPPHIYDLRLREKLFHGVQAVRLNPVGERNPFGRAGLLVHSYMLGANGDSNGCVSIKDYEKFLKAVVSGEVTRLVVVKHLADPPPAMVATGLEKFLRYAFRRD